MWMIIVCHLKIICLLIKYLRSLNLTVLIRKDWTLVGYRESSGPSILFTPHRKLMHKTRWFSMVKCEVEPGSELSSVGANLWSGRTANMNMSVRWCIEAPTRGWVTFPWGQRSRKDSQRRWVLTRAVGKEIEAQGFRELSQSGEGL